MVAISASHFRHVWGRCWVADEQLIDDMLDVTASSAALGKPGGGADLKLGLATAPTLFAWQENAAMGPLIARRFERDGDVEAVRWQASGLADVAGSSDHRPVVRRGEDSGACAQAWRSRARRATNIA